MDLASLISLTPPIKHQRSNKLELYKRREAARSYNSDYTSIEERNVWNTSGMTFPRRVNEPHYATHGRLETIKKRGNSPCCEPHMLEPPT